MQYLRQLRENKWMPLLVISIVSMIAMFVGGIALTALLVVLAGYTGTLITLSRIPDSAPTDGGLKAAILSPVIKARNWLFKHDLVLTVLIGLVVSSIVGIGSVTGIITIALSVLMGDFLVMTFKDIHKQVTGTSLA